MWYTVQQTPCGKKNSPSLPKKYMLVNMNFQNLANCWLVAQPPDNLKPGQINFVEAGGIKIPA